MVLCQCKFEFGYHFEDGHFSTLVTLCKQPIIYYLEKMSISVIHICDIHILCLKIKLILQYSTPAVPDEKLMCQEITLRSITNKN